MAAGTTAAVVHEIGDFLLDGFDFIVPARKGTRLSGVRLRIRQLTGDEVVPVDGLPALTVERTIADLVDIGTAPTWRMTCSNVQVSLRKDRVVADYSGYANRRSVERALKEAARKAARQAGPGVSAATVDAQIRQARFDRFLSRVFADGRETPAAPVHSRRSGRYLDKFAHRAAQKIVIPLQEPNEWGPTTR